MYTVHQLGRGMCFTTLTCKCMININYIISSVMHAFWLVLTYDLLEDRHIDDVIIKTFLILYDIKPIDFKLLCICSVIHHRGRQNVVRTSVTHSAAPCVPLFCSYHILTSSVIDYWTDVQQLGIYLLNRFHVVMHMFSRSCRSQKTSKCGKEK